MSDANAAFSLPPDESRQRIVWVDDFTKAEAHQFLNNSQFMMGKQSKRDEIFGTIGTRPGMLKKMVDEGNKLILTIGEANIDAYVADVIDGAKTTLERLLKLKFYKDDPKAINFKAVHEALLNNPNGVSTKNFAGSTGLPKEACVYLREYHAFLYHYPSKQYRYAGKEYENAAKEL